MKRLPPTVFAVTLGCAKNRVDTEVMLGDLLSHGYALVQDPAVADVVLVNTCGFLAAAREESLSVLREMRDRMRPDARLVVAGCMAERFRAEILAGVDGVDLFVGTRRILDLRGALLGEPAPGFSEPTAVNPRLVTTPRPLAYLKVADGCSRRCAFCIIPAIKGRQRSRPVDDLVQEAVALTSSGVREIVLVAQDLTHYGTDLPARPGLADLVDALAAVAGVRWLRLMYLYPRDLPDRLLDGIARHPNVLNYLDLPVQHGSDRMLAAMRRGTTRRSLLELIRRIRDRIPGVVLRTTFLVGFPGETEADFEQLLGFAEEARFEMAGVFGFSAEPGSLAIRLPEPVPVAVRDRRVRRLTRFLAEQAAGLRARLVGQVHEAVVEETGRRGRSAGRLWFQAPEVDGRLRIVKGPARPGDFLRIRIESVSGNDFIGVLPELRPHSSR